MNKTTLMLLAAIFPFAAACSEAETPVTSEQPSAKTDGRTADAGDAALQRLVSEGGDFRFAFRESAVYAKLKAQCDQADDAASCMAEYEQSAAGEGIRITPIEGLRVRYTSYATDDAGQRKTLLEAEVTLSAVEPKIFELTAAKMLVPENAEPPPGQRFFIELVDEETMAMDKVPGAHPRDGGARLVFHRAAD